MNEIIINYDILRDQTGTSDGSLAHPITGRKRSADSVGAVPSKTTVNTVNAASTTSTIYWRTLATAKEKDQHLVSFISDASTATEGDWKRISVLFDWTIDEVKQRWMKIKSGKCFTRAEGQEEKQTLGRVPFLARAHFVPPPPMVWSKVVRQKKMRQKSHLVVFSAEEKDAKLLRALRYAEAVAGPVNWRDLAEMFALDVSAMQKYAAKLDTAQRTNELILYKVSAHGDSSSMKLWAELDADLGLSNTHRLWTDIATRAGVCAKCAKMHCPCHQITAVDEIATASTATDTTAAIAATVATVATTATVDTASTTASAVAAVDDYSVSVLSEIFPIEIVNIAEAQDKVPVTKPVTPSQACAVAITEKMSSDATLSPYSTPPISPREMTRAPVVRSSITSILAAAVLKAQSTDAIPSAGCTDIAAASTMTLSTVEITYGIRMGAASVRRFSPIIIDLTEDD